MPKRESKTDMKTNTKGKADEPLEVFIKRLQNRASNLEYEKPLESEGDKVRKVNDNYILFDRLRNIKRYGKFYGPIISKLQASIILSNNIQISKDDGISIEQGLIVGFEEKNEKITAFSKKSDFIWKNLEKAPLEYSVLISENIMEQYNHGQFTDDFPFTINLLHTAGLYLNDSVSHINHLNFMKGEIINNPISLIENGIVLADRVVIDNGGDAVFYDCIIIGRDGNDEIKPSFEIIIRIEQRHLLYLIILGREDTGFDKIGMIIKSGEERETQRKKRTELVEQAKKEQEKILKLKKKKENEKKENLKERFLYVEKFIQDYKFSEAILELKEIKEEAEKLNLDDIVNRSNENIDLCYILLIKKTILDLGTKFARIQIVEISEVSEIVDEKLIISTVKDMIKNKEIYAKYFESSKSIAFDQQANIEEIDKLMSIYKDWEEKKVGKK